MCKERFFRELTAVFLVSLLLSGCAGFGAMTDALSRAALNQQDAAIVRDGIPPYLILVDSLILDDPDDSELLLAAARLNSAYAGSFLTDPQRQKLMSAKALDYARRALCEELEEVCAAGGGPLPAYQAALAEVDDSDELPYLYGYAVAWAGWVQANSDNWQAIADLPKIQASIERVLALDDAYDYGNAHVYMGVLLTLRPESLGGQPEAARAHFERALAISGRRNLMAMVLYAQKYARLVFNRELHDRLLREVLSADVEQPGLTLANTLAQQQARELLDSSEEYF
jgi:hypothetical protein